MHPAPLPLVFALPAASDAPSGGNVYNRELTRALGERSVRLVELDGAVRSLRDGQPGVYFFDTLDLERLTALSAPTPRQRLALVVHHLPSFEPDLPAAHPSREAEALALPRFDLFLATSAWTREVLCARGIAPGAVLVVPPAAPPPVARRARAYSPPLVALMVANLVPRKDVLGFLLALGELDAGAPYTLRIVGRFDIEPAYAEACRRAVASSPRLRGAVRFDGALPHAVMAGVYETSHLLVSASQLETFGMAIQEARAHGLPVIACEGGHVSRHFASGEPGRLVASAAEAASALVAFARDERVMAELFAAAQRSRPAGDYDWSAAARRFERELERAGVSAVSKSRAGDR